MDDCGYETYSSFDEAVKTFNHNIALENAVLDLDIGLILESNVDPFSNYAMESITEKVKTLNDKVKSNFIPYAKKLVNLYFGWIMNFIKRESEVSKFISKGYNDAQSALTELNKFESVVPNIDKDYKISISDYLQRKLIKGLIFMQLAINSIQYLEKHLGELKNSKDIANDPVKMMNGLSKIVKSLYEIVYSLPEGNERDAELEKLLVSNNYVIGKIFLKGMNDSSESRRILTKNINSRYGDNEDSKNKIEETIDNKMNQVFEKRLAGYTNVAPDVERSIPLAYKDLTHQLKMFIRVAKSNAWNVNEYITKAEESRRYFNSILSKDQDTNNSNETVAESLKLIVEVGNNLSLLQKATNSILKGVENNFDRLLKDSTKLVNGLKSYSSSNSHNNINDVK